MKKHLVWFLILVILFAALTAAVLKLDLQPIGPEESMVGMASLNRSARETTGMEIGAMNQECYDISEYIGYAALGIAAILSVIWGISFLRKGFFNMTPALRWLPLVYILGVGCYVLFKELPINFRPVIMEEGLEPSFPSSHTVLAVCVFASAPVAITALLKRHRISAVVLNTICFAMLLMIILFRWLSGAHWFTDIIGGILLASVFVELYLMLVSGSEE